MGTQAPTDKVSSGRLLITERRRIEWDLRPLPTRVPAGAARIATNVTAVSPGTELRLYRGEEMAQDVWRGAAKLDKSTPGSALIGGPEPSADNTTGAAAYPAAFGYNNVGTVIAVGHGAKGLEPGDRVFTIARHEQFFDIEPWEATRLPDAVGNDDAVFSYLASLGLHALRRVSWQPGEPLVVIGLGVIGLALALTAQAFGAALTVVDVSQARLALARRVLRTADVMDPGQAAELGGGVARTVIDAAGSVAAVDLAMVLARRGGSIGVLALHPESMGKVLGGLFYEKELSLVATANDPYYVPEGLRLPTVGGNVASIVDLIAWQEVRYRDLITARTAAADAHKAFADLDSQQDGGIVGSVLDWESIADAPATAER